MPVNIKISLAITQAKKIAIEEAAREAGVTMEEFMIESSLALAAQRGRKTLDDLLKDISTSSKAASKAVDEMNRAADASFLRMENFEKKKRIPTPKREPSPPIREGKERTDHKSAFDTSDTRVRTRDGDLIGGVVQWFNAAKGYGLLKQDNGSDVLFYAHQIVRDDFGPISAGERIELKGTSGQRIGTPSKNSAN